MVKQLKQFVGKLPTNCLSVFDHFVGLALKGLIISSYKRNVKTIEKDTLVLHDLSLFRKGPYSHASIWNINRCKRSSPNFASNIKRI